MRENVFEIQKKFYDIRIKFSFVSCNTRGFIFFHIFIKILEIPKSCNMISIIKIIPRKINIEIFRSKNLLENRT